VLQFLVQLPHWSVVFDVFVSQPVFCPVAQWLKPWLQVGLHVPAWHDVVAAFAVLQAVPHLPQSVLLVSRSTQPLAQHAGDVPPHTTPQPWQLRGSVFVSRQSPLQHMSPLAHVPVHALTHAPAGLHLSPPVHSASVLQTTHW
jgi:hypothetical protein